MKTARLAVGLILVAGMMSAVRAVAAQSIPPITKSKQAATRAVAATNAHTRAMTSPTSDSAAAAAAAQGTPAAQRQGGGAPGDSTQPPATGRATQSAAGRAETSSSAFEREIYRYERAGRRDPFVSLMDNGDLRPLITELRVTGIVFDENGRSSVAVLRDLTTKEQYRVRMGSSLGRMRVARIERKSVTFTIEEFGFSRQETLELSDDPNKEKQQ